MLEADDEMTPEERADPEAEIECGGACVACGQGISGDELLARAPVLMKRGATSISKS
jgi:hypothetical protein